MRMQTERTRRMVELINKQNSEQMDKLERFLRELLDIKEEDRGSLVGTHEADLDQVAGIDFHSNTSQPSLGLVRNGCWGQ